MRAVKIFTGVLCAIILIAEVGNRITSFKSDEGSFFILIFWGSILSSLFTLFYCTNNSKQDD